MSNFMVDGESVEIGWEFSYGDVKYIITHIEKDDISFSQKINGSLNVLPFVLLKTLIERERERGQRQRQR